MKCRFCDALLTDVFLDLGAAPPSNALVSQHELSLPEVWFPLKLFVCADCRLVQVDEVQSHEKLFSSTYAYYSSYSSSWLKHAEDFVALAAQRLNLRQTSLVLEVASNDGYLLQYVAARGIPCVGIEPTAGTAEVARGKGIDTIIEFFGVECAQRFARQRGKADLIVANNVLAHVPDLNDFVAGLAVALAPEGLVSVEFPHLQSLVDGNQFDTVYHEHFSYFSLDTVLRVFARHGLRVCDVERLLTHGGSLRVWAAHAGSHHEPTAAIGALRRDEDAAGMLAVGYYAGFQHRADRVKDDLLRFLLDCKRDGRRVVGYGAAAKGNTLLNYAGVRGDLLPYVVDASPHKQGRYLPGSRIPIVAEERIRDERPDVVLILPWNLREEISAQLAYIRTWGGRFATAVPAMEIL